MKRIFLVVFIVMTPLFAAAAEPVDDGDKPLLMEGKHTLYQRVLSTPGARLAAEPGGQGRRCANCHPFVDSPEVSP
jgi:hypothetical protein